MKTSTTTNTIETIIIAINNKRLESSKVNSNESKVSKLKSPWNNYDKRLKWIEDNKMILIWY